MRRALFVVATVVSLGGCLALESLDGLTGGVAAPFDARAESTAPPPPDAGDAATPLEASSDAPAEVGVEDAPNPADGSALDAGDAATPFCASLQPPPFFCCDFDEGQPVDAGWTAAPVQAPAAIALDTTTSFSGPASLLASTPASTTGDWAYLKLQPTSVVTTVHAEVEINPTLLPNDNAYGSVALLRIEQDQSSGTALALMLYFSATRVYLQEEQDAPAFVSNIDNFSATAPYGVWQRWAIDLDCGSSPASATISVDGSAVLSTKLMYGWIAAPIRLFVGDEYNNNNDAMKANFDDVVLTLK